MRWNSSSSSVSSSEPQYYERGIHPLIGPLSDGAVADDDGSDNNALRSDRYFVTTPIFYVNAKPHVGHIYSALLADAAARWQRMRGKRVLFSTGTDEHGLKVQEAAAAAGMEPGDFCDAISQRFRDAFEAFAIEPTDFVRTTEPRHHKTATALWEHLCERGHLTLGQHEGWYCQSDEAFLTDMQVKTRQAWLAEQQGHELSSSSSESECEQDEDMVSSESGHPVVRLTEENYMFDLSNFQAKLLDWVQTQPGAVEPVSAKNEVVHMIAGIPDDQDSGSDGSGAPEAHLRDLSVSRRADKVHWGIPVPGDSSHTMYVWLDALSNYLTVTGATLEQLLEYHSSSNTSNTSSSSTSGNNTEGDSDNPAAWWPADVHVIGKDILKFHTIYWPAFLQAAGLPTPKSVVTHGHWIRDGTKMSKSLGNVVDPLALLSKEEDDEGFPVDVLRYYLLKEGAIGADMEFSIERVAMCTRSTSSTMLPSAMLPRLGAEHADMTEDVDVHFVVQMQSCVHDAAVAFDTLNFAKGLERVNCLLHATNGYFSANTPWALAKQSDPASQARLDITLYHTLESLRRCALLLLPVMPGKAASLLEHLGVPREEWTAAHSVHTWRRGGEHASIGRSGEGGDTQKLVLFTKRQTKPAA